MSTMTYIVRSIWEPVRTESRQPDRVLTTRNPLKPRERRVVRATGSRLAGAVFATLARACGVPAPTATWRMASAPTYENSIGELVLDERSAKVTLFRSTQDGDARTLTRVYNSELTARLRP